MVTGHAFRFSLPHGKIQGKTLVRAEIMTKNVLSINDIDPICATTGRATSRAQQGNNREIPRMPLGGSGRAILVYNIIVDLDEKMATSVPLLREPGLA
jgi:hypothetical protein